jgi:hypothetical protein
VVKPIDTALRGTMDDREKIMSEILEGIPLPAAAPSPPALVVPRQRTSPAAFPNFAPWPGLVTVTDTNVLASAAAYAARGGGVQDLIERVALTGRAPVFVSTHVEDELDEHMERVARDLRVDPQLAWAAWKVQLAPRIRMVELPMSEYLRPEVANVRRTNAECKRHRGDPDDLGTAALAAFLGPSVIVSADSVFWRFGLTAAAESIEVARKLLQAAGIEADWADGLAAVTVVGRLAGLGVEQLWRVAQRFPIPAALIAGGLGFWAYRRGYLSKPTLTSAARRIGTASKPVLERLGESLEAQAAARESLIVVEDPPWREESLAERCARYLARSPRPLTPIELRDALNRSFGHDDVSGAQLKREMLAHPAFVRLPGDVYAVGLPMG